MTSIRLRFDTPQAWVDAVLADFDQFLLDHAAAEKKASGMAVSMLSHYPDKKNLVIAMADLAIEEMSHYREVVKLIHQRGHITSKDEKDPYVIEFRNHLRNGKEEYFLDRLLGGWHHRSQRSRTFWFNRRCRYRSSIEAVLSNHYSLRRTS